MFVGNLMRKASMYDRGPAKSLDVARAGRPVAFPAGSADVLEDSMRRMQAVSTWIVPMASMWLMSKWATCRRS